MRSLSGKKNLTVQEAADVLNVRRERIWKLLADGVLSAQPSRLDGRQKLIPSEQVEKLLLEEGFRPRRVAQRRRTTPAPTVHHTGGVDRATHEATTSDSGHAPARGRLPRTIARVDDELFHARESEAYMHEHLNSDHFIAE